MELSTLTTVGRRVCSNDALDVRGGGNQGRCSFSLPSPPKTAKIRCLSEVFFGRVDQRERYTSAHKTLRLIAYFPRFINPRGMCSECATCLPLKASHLSRATLSIRLGRRILNQPKVYNVNKLFATQ